MSSKTPEIRFDGFTDDWEQRKFSSILDAKDGIRRGPFGSALKKDLFVSESNYVVYEQQNAIYDRFNTRYNISIEKYNELIKFKIVPGDFIMSGAGTIGRISRVPKGVKPGVFNQALIRFKLNRNITDSNYFLQLMRSESMQRKLTSSNPGSAMMNLVPMSELKKWAITVPSLSEQMKLGNFFVELDKTIALHQRQLENLEKNKKAFLQKMFPRNNKIAPEIRLRTFDEGWNEHKVCEIFEVTRGKVLAFTETSKNRTSESPYPVYSSQTKNEGLMGYYKDYLFDTAITWTTDGANAGTVKYRKGKFYSTNVNGVLLSEKGYINKAIAEALNKVAWKYVSKVGNPKLMNNIMSNISITIPNSIEEQNEISEMFDKLDNSIVLHQRQLENLKQMKKAFLQKMFV